MVSMLLAHSKTIIFLIFVASLLISVSFAYPTAIETDSDPSKGYQAPPPTILPLTPRKTIPCNSRNPVEGVYYCSVSCSGRPGADNGGGDIFASQESLAFGLCINDICICSNNLP